MNFLVTDIEYDFEGTEFWGDMSPDEQQDLIKDTLGVWEVDDEEDLVDEISSVTGWCIKSIDYVLQLK